MRKSVLLSVFTIMTFSGMYAGELEWKCDPYSYQYDMTVYLAVTEDGTSVTDVSAYKIGAFCGDECRGIVEQKNSGGHPYLYLRIRSNKVEGETILFRAYNKNNTDKISHSINTLCFKAQSIVGLPSSPFSLSLVNTYTISFDTNGGNEIAPISQDYGTPVTPPADPIRKGYKFIGWDKDIPEIMPAEDVSVKAQWQLNSFSVAVSSAGIATLYSDRNLIVPEGASVYGLTYHSDGNYLNYSNEAPTPGSVIPGNKGYIIESPEGSYVFEFTEELPTADISSDLSGVTSVTKASDITDATGGTIYILANGASGIGFYSVNGTRTLKTNAAYYLLSQSQNSSSVAFIGFNIVDAIEVLNATGNEGLDVNSAKYNVAGQHINENYKGLFICNGQKFINK